MLSNNKALASIPTVDTYLKLKHKMFLKVFIVFIFKFLFDNLIVIFLLF